MLPISASQIAGITAMSRQHPASVHILIMCKGGEVTPVIPAPGRWRQEDCHVRDQPRIHSENFSENNNYYNLESNYRLEVI
jgi:hypothetical protein